MTPVSPNFARFVNTLGVYSDRAPRGETVANRLAANPAFASARIARRAFGAQGLNLAEACDDFSVVVLSRAPSEALLLKLNAAARSTAILVVAGAAHISMVRSYVWHRAVACLAFEDANSAALAASLLNLQIAKLNADKLVSDLTAAHAEIAQLRAAQSALDGAVGLAVDILCEISGDLADAPSTKSGGYASCRAIDAAAELIVTREQAAQIYSPRRAYFRRSGPVNLNDLVIAIAQDAEEEGITAITSGEAVALAAGAAEANALLGGIVEKWRGLRAAGDRLDLLVCDAGDTARLSAVFRWAGKPDPFGQNQTVALQILRGLSEAAKACQASVVAHPPAKGQSQLAVVTIDFRKRGVAPFFALPSASANRSLQANAQP